jgi:hypothetical protein
MLASRSSILLWPEGSGRLGLNTPACTKEEARRWKWLFNFVEAVKNPSCQVRVALWTRSIAFWETMISCFKFPSAE